MRGHARLRILAIEAFESGCEHMTDEAVENWEPEFDADAAFA